jgi:Rod binding domain-containing protein
MIIAGNPPSLPVTEARPKDDRARVESAAGQFEALLIGQLLKGVHASDGGWLGTGDDESMSSAMEYAQEMFAQSLASSGGLGLAKIVAAGFHSSEDI